MTNRNKQRGNELERQVVKMAKERGLVAERAYASNGESLGEDKEVDVLLGSYRIQCKRRKSTFPKWLFYQELVRRDKFDLLVIKQDKSIPLVICNLKWFLDNINEDYDFYEER